MRLSEIGEFGLIERIRKIASTKSSLSRGGIGDDAAALTLSRSRTLLVTTDLLIEDVHFDLSFTDFYSLGWKAAAVNLSDIAAMGGVPRYCLSALGIPDNLSVEHIADFYRGFNSLLSQHSVSLVGGDTCSSKRGLFISITALGDVERSRMITRGGAKPGDRIFVTGTLGDSAAGLELLRNPDCRLRNQRQKIKSDPKPRALRSDCKSEIRNPKSEIGWLIQRHLRPVPRVEWGRALALSGCASAMIDISDGLSSDLSHICTQSHVGAEIEMERLPLSASLRDPLVKLKKTAMQYALSGGEDYELLFTVPPAKLKKIGSLRIAITEIGVVKTGKNIFMIDSRGRKNRVLPTGYDHFKNIEKTAAPRRGSG